MGAPGVAGPVTEKIGRITITDFRENMANLNHVFLGFRFWIVVELTLVIGETLNQPRCYSFCSAFEKNQKEFQQTLFLCSTTVIKLLITVID